MLTIYSRCGQTDKNLHNNSPKYAVIAYYHAGDTIIDENSIKANQLTHINYAFANIIDGKIVEGYKYDSLNFVKLNRLKKINKNLKILISVGGWAWSGNFSDMALSKQSRQKFIQTCVDFINKYNLDGIDLDWEYPALPGNNNMYRTEDKKNFTLLLKELRAALNQNERTGKKYLLSIAAGAFPDYVQNVELEKIVPYLDFINLMSYDFAGGWDDTTGYLSNLYRPENNEQLISCNKAIQLFNQMGVPKNKLVLGAAFYGRGWTDVNPQNKGLFQKANGEGLEFSYKTLVLDYIDKNNYKSYYDSVAEAPYLWNDSLKTFITYENPQSIQAKCKYIEKNKLYGIMFWQYTGDYKNELLNAIIFSK